MALNFNSVQPTQIIAKDSGSAQTIAFPTGTKTVTVFQQTIDGKKQAVATFTSTHNITANMVICNDKTLNSSSQLISEQNDTKTSTTYLFYAKFSNNTLSLEQTVVYSVTGEPPQSVILRGRDYSETFYSATDLTVLKYSVTEKGLSGEATRASVSSYSKAALDSYVGLVNDTWGGITNASSLSHDKYYYIRVLVTDTNRYGKFCIRFKSYNGQTITTDNIGWGYDGEIIATIPVWGKPFSLTIQAGANSTVAANRTSSPNQHASTGNITSGGIVYYGDTLTITATPASGYKLVSFTINGTEYANGETSAVSQTITVTSAVSVVINTESAVSWKTVWTGNEQVATISYKGETSGNKSVTLTNETLAGVDWSRPTKITGVASASAGGINGETNEKNLTGLELVDKESKYLVGVSIITSSGGVQTIRATAEMRIKRNANNSEVIVSASCTRNYTKAGIFFLRLTLTKVEQYY